MNVWKITTIVLLLSIAGYFARKWYVLRQVNTTVSGAVKMKHFDNRQDIFSVLTIDSNSIVFLGDSHTQNFEIHEFFTNDNLRNRGIRSDRTDQLLSRSMEIAKSHPNKVFIQIGVNDILQGKYPDSAVINIKSLIGIFKETSPASKIYLETVIPSARPLLKDKIIRLNQKILALSKSERIEIINVFDSLQTNGLLKPDYDCGDGLHLNGKGYLVMTKIISPYL